MLSFLSALLSVIPLLWAVWQKLEGTPEQRRVELLKRIEASGGKFKDTGDTSDLGDFR